jgi:hypothetical protein
MAVPEMRPRRVGEILDAAIKLYLGNARVLMGSAAAIVIPLQIISGAILLSTYSDGKDINTGFAGFGRTVTVTPAEAHARLGATAITTLVSLIGSAFVLAACVKALSDAYLGQDTTVRGSLRFGLRRLLPLIALEIVYAIGLVFGFVLLVVPGIWLYAAWSVRVPALIIERAGPFRALGRSRLLVSGRWWPTAGVLLVSYLMVVVIGGLVGAALGALALQSGNPSALLAVTISVLSAIVSGVLLQPFSASVVTVLYYDLRIRHEGYDIELLADQLGLPSSELPAPPGGGFDGPVGPDDVGKPGGPPFWPPPPGWQRGF